jgi:hypothetical protein
MNGSFLWTLLFIIAFIFVIYALCFSTNSTVQAWGYLILALMFLWFTIVLFMGAYELFKAPTVQSTTLIY